MQVPQKCSVVSPNCCKGHRKQGIPGDFFFDALFFLIPHPPASVPQMILGRRCGFCRGNHHESPRHMPYFQLAISVLHICQAKIPKFAYEAWRRTPCNPCVFFNSASGCFKGQSCTFCHHSATPGHGLLTRPSKLNRARTKEKVEHLLSKLMEADMNSLSDEIHYGLQAEAQKDDFSRRFCQGRLNEVLLTLQPRPSRRPYEFGCRCWVAFSL